MLFQASEGGYVRAEEPEPRSEWGARIVNHRYFLGTILVLVLGNTIVMATEHAGQPEYWTEFLRWSNIFFVIAFTLEMVTKLLALGPALYWFDRFNRFDAVVVVLSVIEVLCTEVLELQGFGVAIFRAVRLVRAVSMIQTWWKPLKALGVRLMQNIETIGSMLGLLQLFILIFGLLGMQIFGGKDPVQNSRSNFNDFWAAYLSIFQVLTGENWNEIMYDCMSINGESTLYGPFAPAPLRPQYVPICPYFLTTFCLYGVVSVIR